MGLEAHGRVWDVRSGANVLNLRGHANGVLCVDFAPSGATSYRSEDHTVKVWDLRNVKGCLYTIPARQVRDRRSPSRSAGAFYYRPRTTDR